jgi:cyclopropane-fatty-acyl-phospholipid synthase
MLENFILNRVEERIRDVQLPIAVQLWDGQMVSQTTDPKVKVVVHSMNALKHLAQPTLGGLAQSYVKREIDLEGDTHDLVNLGDMLCRASHNIGHRLHLPLKLTRHNRDLDRQSISYHYDVSNDFYALWLDRNRVYSCGYFKSAQDSLDQAQEQKLDHICRKLDLQPGERFLDIGCGWGGLIMWAAQHYQVRATGVTISQNQYDYIMGELKRRGLQDLVEVRLMDYRDIPEDQPFDKIASVGMFEHVGKANLPEYFAKMDRLLKPGGVALNHGITGATVDYQGLGSGISEFVHDYVFPNGELVHISHVLAVMAQAGLEARDVESLRPHYAMTLWRWVENLEQQQEAARAMIGEDKYRIWRIYMAGSAYAFERNWLSLYQVLAGKPLADGTLPYPLTREHMYRNGE